MSTFPYYQFPPSPTPQQAPSYQYPPQYLPPQPSPQPVAPPVSEAEMPKEECCDECDGVIEYGEEAVRLLHGVKTWSKRTGGPEVEFGANLSGEAVLHPCCVIPWTLNQIDDSYFEYMMEQMTEGNHCMACGVELEEKYCSHCADDLEGRSDDE